MSLPPTPPAARTVPFTFEHLGRAFTDEYAWLQEKTNPEVIAYLTAENDYARQVLRHTEPLQDQLFSEMRGRIAEDDSSVPEQRDDYFYYWRIQAGQQYKVYCRRHGSLDAPEQVLLDENRLAEGKAYCRVVNFEPSPDNRLAAYGVDTTGAWVFDLYVQDLETGRILSGPIPQTAYSIAWASDSRTLFYTRFDAAHRPYQLLRHAAGSDPAQDALLFHETDDHFALRVRRSRSGAFILLTLHSHSTTEVRYLPADQPAAELRVIRPREHWLEYYVEHQAGPDGGPGRFLIRSNEDALNFKLLEAPESAPGKENWREVLPHRADTYLLDVNAFRDYLVLNERQDGLPRLRVSAPDGLSGVFYVEFPDPDYAIEPLPNPAYEARVMRFQYSSLVTPRSVIDYDMAAHAWVVKKVQEIPSGYDASRYACHRLHACAADGALVPISIVHRAGLALDGSHPLLLAGYGSYGFDYDPAFDLRIFSLLDRGFVYGIAHVRGGSELGRTWYEDGRLMHKKNSFTDLVACAEHLVSQGYTQPERLAIYGASAGGLLVTATANLRPDLFKAVVAMVPFTNVITAMLDPDLPLTVIEYEQWGSPYDAQAFDYMLSYSPYENIQPAAYPQMFVKAGLNDLQVPYWDPAKFVARLRARKTDANRLALVTNMGAGHGGASGRYDHLREDAQWYAFVIDALCG